MDEVVIEYDNLTFKNVTTKHIEMGWLEWLENPQVAANLTTPPNDLSFSTLQSYLNDGDFHYFLAGHLRTDNTYIGNLRVYRLTSGAYSFGRLIAPQYQGQGYGTIFSKVAQLLVFDRLKGNLLIVGNGIKNIVSRQSKVRSGFLRMDKEMMKAHNLIEDQTEYFYINLVMFEAGQ